MNINVGVLGGGSWGTALGILLAEKGINVDIWIRDKKQHAEILESKENKKYLPNVGFPINLIPTNNVNRSIIGKDILVLAIPTHGVRDFLQKNKNIIKKEQIIVNVAKGIEIGSLKRISEIVKDELPENEYVILSGPSHAEEVAIGVPTTVISASENKKVAKKIQDIFMTPLFRVYTNTDVVGVELGGALKNIIALGAGISDGLGYGDNAKAALMTRGIFEMSRLGEKLGANKETFAGLAGIGDLIVTCTSIHSRNRRAGILIGEGCTLEEATDKVGMVVEGVRTTNSAYKLSRELGIDMPITKAIYEVLYEDANVKKSVLELMDRPKKNEMDNIIKK